LKIKVLDTDLVVGSIRKTVSSINILPFRYELFGPGVNITCQLCDDTNCILLEEIIFISKDKINNWAEYDNYIVEELLIRLGLKKYSDKAQGNKNIEK
jgi:hypothetical protein